MGWGSGRMRSNRGRPTFEAGGLEHVGQGGRAQRGDGTGTGTGDDGTGTGTVDDGTGTGTGDDGTGMGKRAQGVCRPYSTCSGRGRL